MKRAQHYICNLIPLLAASSALKLAVNALTCCTISIACLEFSASKSYRLSCPFFCTSILKVVGALRETLQSCTIEMWKEEVRPPSKRPRLSAADGMKWMLRGGRGEPGQEVKAGGRRGQRGHEANAEIVLTSLHRWRWCEDDDREAWEAFVGR